MWQGEGVTVHTARLDGFVTIIHPPVSSLSFVEHNFGTTIFFSLSSWLANPLGVFWCLFCSCH